MEKRMENLIRTMKARERAVNKLLDQYYFDKIMEGSFNLDHFIEEEELEELEEYVERRQKRRYKYIMITVNPKEDTPWRTLNKKVLKCIAKKWIKNATWCYEWREKKMGLHAHIRCEIEDKNPCEINRECYNTFKHLVGNKLHVNIKMSNANKAFLNYVKGLKNGKQKENAEHDEINRKELGINPWETMGMTLQVEMGHLINPVPPLSCGGKRVAPAE